MHSNFKVAYMVGAVVLILFFILAVTRMFFIVDAGERGVIFRPYTRGLDRENIYGEGFHIVAPWNRMYVYSVREQQREETMDVLDRMEEKNR